MTNVIGQHFDVMRPGNFTFVQIPMFAPNDQGTLIRVQAVLQRFGSGCEDIYITKLDMTGTWPDEKKIGGFHFDSDGRGDSTDGSWWRLGKVDVKVANGRTKGGAEYLNFFIRKLAATGFQVGGLLGESDHTEASMPSAHCKSNLLLSGSLRPETAGKSRSQAEAFMY